MHLRQQTRHHRRDKCKRPPLSSKVPQSEARCEKWGLPANNVRKALDEKADTGGLEIGDMRLKASEMANNDTICFVYAHAKADRSDVSATGRSSAEPSNYIQGRIKKYGLACEATKLSRQMTVVNRQAAHARMKRAQHLREMRWLIL